MARVSMISRIATALRDLSPRVRGPRLPNGAGGVISALST